MTTLSAGERLRLMEAETEARRRLAGLQADAMGLALRFARDGNGAAGAELAIALKECLQACEAVARDVAVVWGSLGRGEELAREDYRHWLGSLRTRLAEDAADVHREAEQARLANDARKAGRLFAIKHRFELVAGAVGELAARR